MDAIRIKRADFVAAAHSSANMPALQAPEIALIGRSNAGKSTLLNKLCARKNLARTSATPGRTQQVNFFEVVGIDKRNQEFALTLVDLPGFGFAKLSKSRREELSELCVNYILQRANLKIVLLLVDCRRRAEAEELAVRDLAFDAGKVVQVVATKLDKLKKSQIEESLTKLAHSFGLEASDLLRSGTVERADKLWEALLTQLDAVP